MYLRYGLLADAVVKGDRGKSNIIGTFDVMGARDFPVTRDSMVLILRIEGHVNEEGEHTLEVDFVDDDFNSVADKHSVKFEAKATGRPVETAPLSVEFSIGINNLTLPKPGNYEFAIRLDGRHIGSVPLYVRRAERPES